MAARNAITVKIRGQEFRILANDDGESLQRVAQYLNETMALVERQTGTVDSLDLALLSALNLARELVDIRDGRISVAAAPNGRSAVDPLRIEALIELAESALEASAA